MPNSLNEISSCLDVTESMVEAALKPAESLTESTPRERVFALLDRMAEVAKPRQGAPKMLLILARVASCAWIEGDLEVRVIAHDGKTAIDLFVNDGLSLQKLRASIFVSAPYEEFRRALSDKPHLVAPLTVAGTAGATKTRLLAQGASAEPEAPKPIATLPPRRTKRPPPPSNEPPSVVGKIALRRIAVPVEHQSKRATKRPPSQSKHPAAQTKHPSASKQQVTPPKQPTPPKSSREPTGRR